MTKYDEQSFGRTAAAFNIRHHAIIGVWERSYRDGGFDALVGKYGRIDRRTWVAANRNTASRHHQGKVGKRRSDQAGHADRSEA